MLQQPTAPTDLTPLSMVKPVVQALKPPTTAPTAATAPKLPTPVDGSDPTRLTPPTQPTASVPQSAPTASLPQTAPTPTLPPTLPASVLGAPSAATPQATPQLTMPPLTPSPTSSVPTVGDANPAPSLTTALASAGRTPPIAPPGAPADANVSAPVSTPQLTATGNTGNTPSVAPLGPAGGVPGVSGAAVTGINPSNDLRGDAITPTNDVNRFDLAKSNFQNYLNGELPQYRADLRNTIQNNAAMGRLGSGMLRTSVGNLDLAEQEKANQAQTGFLNDALQGTIGDAANNRNELRTERDYQNQQENQAYNRNLQGVSLQDALTNSAFGRSLAQEQAGEANSPANMGLILSSIFGNNAASAQAGLGNLIGGTTANNAAQGSQGSGLPDWLQQLLDGGNGVSPSDQSGIDAILKAGAPPASQIGG